jgi:hypothetical protein
MFNYTNHGYSLGISNLISQNKKSQEMLCGNSKEYGPNLSDSKVISC